MISAAMGGPQDTLGQILNEQIEQLERGLDVYRENGELQIEQASLWQQELYKLSELKRLASLLTSRHFNEHDDETYRLRSQIASLQSEKQWLAAQLNSRFVRWFQKVNHHLLKLPIHPKNMTSVAQLAKRFVPVAIHEPANRASAPSTTDLPTVLTKPLQSPAPLSDCVLQVADLNLSQCAQYRVVNKMDQFGLAGQHAMAIDYTRYDAVMRALPFARAVIFYRVPATSQVLAYIREAKRLGIKTVYEIDDMIFDTEVYRNNPNLQTLTRAEREHLIGMSQSYAIALKACDEAIASTQQIADAMTKHTSGKIHVIENGISYTQINGIAATSPTNKHEKTELTIAYGSGSRAHDKDFAVAEDALIQVLSCHPNVRLVVFGYLQVSARLKGFSSQLRTVGFLDTADYYRALASVDITIAPLVDDIFNSAKSNLKFFESALYEIPLVASATSNFPSIIENGKNGFLARTSDDWKDALEQLIASQELRKRIGKAAKASSLARYSPQRLAKTQVRAFLDSLPVVARSPTRKRILVVNVHFYPDSFGGATIVAEQLTKLLAKNTGLELFVLSRLGESTTGEFTLVRYDALGAHALGIRMHPLRVLDEAHQNPQAGLYFDSILSALQPDVVHFHCLQMLSASVVEPCVRRGVPFAITLHDSWWICERQFQVNNEQRYCFQTRIDLTECASCVPDVRHTYRRFHYLTDILKKANLLLAPSQFQRELYAANGFDSERLKVNKNGVLPSRAKTPKRVVGAKLVFAYVGGRSTHKGFFALRDIFARIRMSNYELRIVDVERKLSKEEYNAAEWQAAGSVKVVAPFAQDELDAFYSDVNVLLFPSQWKESFGLVVREALLRDVWVIGTDAGGTRDALVDGENSSIVQIGDFAGYQGAIETLLKDPSLLDGYSNPHKNLIRTFEEQAAELTDLLLSIAQPYASSALGPNNWFDRQNVFAASNSVTANNS